MKRLLTNTPVEYVFTTGLVLVMVALSLVFDLPIRGPSGSGAAMLGLQLVMPLLGVAGWVLCAVLGNRRASPLRLLLALACYGVIMVVHFNIKFWVPFIRSDNYDLLLWQTDQCVRPLVDLCIRLCRLLPAALFESRIYLWSFLTLFYVSFGYHALVTPGIFRKLFLAALFMQGLGALSYLLMPAAGPFLYETGVSPVDTVAQQQMMALQHVALAAGPHWLANNLGANLFAGLGAMPSLHAGCSFLFLWFAWRYGRPLLPTYIPIFAYILVTAVASRWHYVIDIPVGIALARLAIFLAFRLDREPAADASKQEKAPMAEAEPAYA